MIIPFELNGKAVYSDSNPGERLVHILRKKFKLLGSKEGCLTGRCGSCMVLMGGNPVPSCIVPVFQVRNTSIVTIEGFRETDDYNDIVKGFATSGVAMCGFCNAGKILIAHTILATDNRPTRDTVKGMFSGNICRCTDLESLIEGVLQAGIIRRKRQNVK